MKWSERKAIKAESKKAIEKISHWYLELEKLDPSQNISSDRINTVINRLRSIRNDREIMLLSSRIFWLSVFQILLSVVLIASFFVQPKMQIDFTLSAVVVSIATLSSITVIPILLSHFLSREDRATSRKRNLAEERNLERQLKNS